MTDIPDILIKIAFLVVLSIISNAIIPYLKAKYDTVRWTKLINMVQAAVEAAEQTIKGEGQGQVKKDDVLLFVTNWLNTNDISVSEREVDRLIEAAVYKMNEKKRSQ